MNDSDLDIGLYKYIESIEKPYREINEKNNNIIIGLIITNIVLVIALVIVYFNNNDKKPPHETFQTKLMRFPIGKNIGKNNIGRYLKRP